MPVRSGLIQSRRGRLRDGAAGAAQDERPVLRAEGDRQAHRDLAEPVPERVQEC